MNVRSRFHLPRLRVRFRTPSRAARPLVLCAAIGMLLVLAACASTAPAVVPENASAQVATQWHAPLPHDGRVEDLRQWWSRFDDPLMPHLIEAAQRASPALAQAAANMADARASSVTRGAALLPR